MKTLASSAHDRSVLPVGLDLHGLGGQRPKAAERVPGPVTGPAPALPALFEQVGPRQLVPAITHRLPRVAVSAVTEGVLGVLGLRTPVQVLWAVVAGQIVLVECPQTRRPRTDERFRDENVNTNRTALAIATERYTKMPRLRACVETQDSPSTVLTQRLSPSVGRTSDDAIEGADAPLVTDFVQIFVADYWTPAFWGGHE